MKTQRERVLAAARRFNGVAQTDFLAPNVCDDGAPITRVAARLFELDQEGYAFECIGRRNRCKVFRLVSDPDIERTVSAAAHPARQSPSSPGAGVERPAGEGSPLAPKGDSASSACGPLSTGRLFDVPPEPHWKSEAA